jgi:cell division protein ZapE
MTENFLSKSTVMTPLRIYLEKTESGAMVLDLAQLAVMQELNTVHHQLIREHRRRRTMTAILRKSKTVPGLYLCGGVGIGKTFMMDCFYQAIPFSQKLRMHFHGFMRMVHQKLKEQQGKKNPVKQIAKELAKKYMIICFDEFIVNDITDAMLLARLLDGLFASGVTLVATSNVLPVDLYKRGLQRDQFVPAILLIEHHTKIISMKTVADYRSRHLNHAGIFYVPNDDAAQEEMEKNFTMLSTHNEIHENVITICDREVRMRKSSGDIIWFNFADICRPPRSQQDYLALAETYKTVFISDIPVMAAHENDKIALFIRLIDVFYDAHVRLVISAEDTIEKLYVDGRMLFEYGRACSRLREMQSSHYFYEDK